MPNQVLNVESEDEVHIDDNDSDMGMEMDIHDSGEYQDNDKFESLVDPVQSLQVKKTLRESEKTTNTAIDSKYLNSIVDRCSNFIVKSKDKSKSFK